MTVLPVVVLISGGGSNLRALLDAAADPAYPARIVAVGADREAEGLAHAEHHRVATFTVPLSSFDSREAWGDELVAQIRQWNPGLVVLSGFMRLLPADAVRALAPNLINTHPSLLPAFPGAHAVRDALAAGASETGASVIVVDDGVDTGPVIVQKRIAIEPGDDQERLHGRIKAVERELLIRVVRDIADGSLNLEELSRA